jgi:hypothetical protein
MTDREWLAHCLLMLARNNDPRNAADVVAALDTYFANKEKSE